MNTYFCNICRGSHKSNRILATYKATCLLDDVKRMRSSYKRNIAEARPPTPSASTLDEAPPPSEPSIPNEPLYSDLNELNLDDLDDYLDEDFLSFLIMNHLLILITQMIALCNELERLKKL
jgi:hypothetical protein